MRSSDPRVCLGVPRVWADFHELAQTSAVWVPRALQDACAICAQIGLDHAETLGVSGDPSEFFIEPLEFYVAQRMSAFVQDLQVGLCALYGLRVVWGPEWPDLKNRQG